MVVGLHFDPDAFGRFSEGIARFLGTGRFLAGQTVAVVVWISVNAVAVRLRWDPYPFILLNLAFSTQAAYAAPLILLAQNRQDDRDRAQAEMDREVNFRTQAEAEFLARELASVRLTLADVATIDELQDAVDALTDALGDAVNRIESKLDAGGARVLRPRDAPLARRWPSSSRSSRWPPTACRQSDSALDLPAEPDAPVAAGDPAPTSEPTPTVDPIVWEACDGAQCATVAMPLDHDVPDGQTIDLFVRRLPATGDRLGSLFLNFGGPGGTAADLIDRFPVPNRLRERFDIVGMDPRGVGRSTPLDCGIDPTTLYSVDPTIDDAIDVQALLDVSTRYADDCAADRGDLLPHLGTRDVARDMDRIRAGMGDEQLSYVGFSYGTSIGQAYADLFPERVRAMVLDGVVDTAPAGIDAAVVAGRGLRDRPRQLGRRLSEPVIVPVRRRRHRRGRRPAGPRRAGGSVVEWRPSPRSGRGDHRPRLSALPGIALGVARPRRRRRPRP